MMRDPEELLAHTRFIRSLAVSLVKDRHVAADTVQDTWVAVLRNPPDDRGAVRSWLTRVVLNSVRKRKRSDLRRRHREASSARLNRAPSTAEVVETEEIRRRVVDAVVRLDEPYRSTLLLRYYDDLPPRKVAEALDVPKETVKTWIQRGLERLRADLAPKLGHGRAGTDGPEAWLASIASLAGLELVKRGAQGGGLSLTGSGAALSMKVKAILVVALLVVAGVAVRTLVTDPGGREGPSGLEGPAMTPDGSEEDGEGGGRGRSIRR